MRYNSKFHAEIQAIAKIGGWKYDVSKGEIIWTNQIGYIHGFPTEVKPSLELLLSVYTPQSRELFLEAFNNAQSKCIPFKIELKLKTLKKGRGVWVRCIGRPLLVCEASNFLIGSLPPTTMTMRSGPLLTSLP